ncbi:hypothetical protein HPB47_021900 [Ixodes persulcatus]|uniref:Uncharacterized protein n=1 Tax=Ixodes persulcatus TaxID=34615 RepID=A0AC60QB91_IXOPE|nr:hypothetical protein HPB47_021900 [Ixodes persulcatus]
MPDGTAPRRTVDFLAGPSAARGHASPAGRRPLRSARDNRSLRGTRFAVEGGEAGASTSSYEPHDPSSCREDTQWNGRFRTLLDSNPGGLLEDCSRGSWRDWWLAAGLIDWYGGADGRLETEMRNVTGDWDGGKATEDHRILHGTGCRRSRNVKGTGYFQYMGSTRHHSYMARTGCRRSMGGNRVRRDRTGIRGRKNRTGSRGRMARNDAGGRSTQSCREHLKDAVEDWALPYMGAAGLQPTLHVPGWPSEDHDKVVECVATEQFFRELPEAVMFWVQERLSETNLLKAAELAEEHAMRRGLQDDSSGKAQRDKEGDSGYPLEPWLMTPVPGRPALGTQAGQYNQAHASMRAVVERCIVLLKSRFRCLHRHRTLYHYPKIAGTIVAACAVLHDVCLCSGEAELEPQSDSDSSSDVDDDEEESADAAREWRGLQ